MLFFPLFFVVVFSRLVFPLVLCPAVVPRLEIENIFEDSRFRRPAFHLEDLDDRGAVNHGVGLGERGVERAGHEQVAVEEDERAARTGVPRGERAQVRDLLLVRVAAAHDRVDRVARG